MNYEDFRREYIAQGLSANQLQENPIEQFHQWMQQAVASELVDPTAMVLGTVDEQGDPWQRIVLCKGVDQDGFTFFTNYKSGKAQAMASNANVSLLFPWNALNRQVIVAGTAQKVSEEVSAAYFASRPRESQIAAWASSQSELLAGREALEAQFADIERRFADGNVPLPPFWGGYRVVPHLMEFWQGRESRLHDRFRYRLLSDNSWQVTQLQP
ncbi:MAG: pyridoxamine 5'-phosphate oxidase [Halioglobus sp.]